MNFNIKEAFQGAQRANQALNAFHTVVRVTDTRPTAAAENSNYSTSSLLASFLAVVTGVLAMISGVFGALSIHLTCIVAGAITVFLGFLIIMFEVPICCPFVTYTTTVTKFSQSRPAWQKAVLYLIPPLAPLLLCQSVSIFFGCILLLINGLAQVKVAMDRRASTETADDAATAETNPKNAPPAPSGLSGSLMNETVVTEKKGFAFNDLA